MFKVIEILPERPMPIEQQQAQAWEILASEAQQQRARRLRGALKAKWRPAHDLRAAPPTAPDFCSNSPTVQ